MSKGVSHTSMRVSYVSVGCHIYLWGVTCVYGVSYVPLGCHICLWGCHMHLWGCHASVEYLICLWGCHIYGMSCVSMGCLP